MCKFSFSFRIMAILYFINWIVAAENIEGGSYSREKTICGNTVFWNVWLVTFSGKLWEGLEPKWANIFMYVIFDGPILYLINQSLWYISDDLYSYNLKTCLKLIQMRVFSIYKSNPMNLIHWIWTLCTVTIVSDSYPRFIGSDVHAKQFLPIWLPYLRFHINIWFW